MLSVLIVNWNTRDFLHRCLSSLTRFPLSEPIEIVVVDNASTDGSAEMVRQEFPTVILLEPGRNLGYAEGNNLAFDRSSGDLVLLLNPDVELLDDSIDRAVRRLRHESDVNILASRLLNEDGSTQASVRGFPSVLGLFGAWTGLGRRRPGGRFDSYFLTAFDYDVEGPAPQPMGTFLLFRRSDLSAPLMDPQFPIFFNEVDLLWRLRQSGQVPRYDPKIRVRHFGGASTRQVKPMMVWESHRSLVRYLRKNATGATRAWLPILALIIYGGAFVRTRTVHPGFSRHDHYL